MNRHRLQANFAQVFLHVGNLGSRYAGWQFCGSAAARSMTAEHFEEAFVPAVADRRHRKTGQEDSI